MSVYTSIRSVSEEAKGNVVVIGNFDGVHLGHRAILSHGKKMADARGLTFGVLTFEPHPRKLFRPDDPPFRITPAAIKQRVLEECGVDFIVSLDFNWDFASQSAEDFIEHVLIQSLNPALVLVGFDFRFGQLRKGSAETMRGAGLHVESLSPVCDDRNVKYSSTAIRELLMTGDIAAANAMLGREWEIEGVIVRGDRRGHELGYPTANVLLHDGIHPAYGIYASLVQIEGEDLWRPAATNIGIRPMFEVREGQVEAHILDFEDRDLYGQTLRIRPLKRLRGEAKFASLEALIEQIEQDCEEIRKILT